MSKPNGAVEEAGTRLTGGAVVTGIEVAAAIMCIVSIIEIYAVERARRYWSKKEKELPTLVAEMIFIVLADPENRKKIRELVMDQDFLDATSKTIFESLKAGIYGLLGLDKKEQNKVAGALIEDSTPIGALLNMVPPDSKIGKMIKSNPQSAMALINVLGKMFSAQPQQAAPYMTR